MNFQGNICFMTRNNKYFKNNKNKQKYLMYIH